MVPEGHMVGPRKQDLPCWFSGNFMTAGTGRLCCRPEAWLVGGNLGRPRM